MGPYESFLSGKPVITTTDAGGPLEVVHDRETGLVVAPEAAAMRPRLAWLRQHPGRGGRLRQRGMALAERGHLGPRDRAAAL